MTTRAKHIKKSGWTDPGRRSSVDAVGGTSIEAALRRIEQVGGKLISWTQLLWGLQRDWTARRPWLD